MVRLYLLVLLAVLEYVSGYTVIQRPAHDYDDQVYYNYYAPMVEYYNPLVWYWPEPVPPPLSERDAQPLLELYYLIQAINTYRHPPIHETKLDRVVEQLQDETLRIKLYDLLRDVDGFGDITTIGRNPYGHVSALASLDINSFVNDYRQLIPAIHRTLGILHLSDALDYETREKLQWLKECIRGLTVNDVHQEMEMYRKSAEHDVATEEPWTIADILALIFGKQGDDTLAEIEEKYDIVEENVDDPVDTGKVEEFWVVIEDAEQDQSEKSVPGGDFDLRVDVTETPGAANTERFSPLFDPATMQPDISENHAASTERFSPLFEPATMQPDISGKYEETVLAEGGPEILWETPEEAVHTATDAPNEFKEEYYEQQMPEDKSEGGSQVDPQESEPEYPPEFVIDDLTKDSSDRLWSNQDIASVDESENQLDETETTDSFEFKEENYEPLTPEENDDDSLPVKEWKSEDSVPVVEPSEAQSEIWTANITEVEAKDDSPIDSSLSDDNLMVDESIGHETLEEKSEDKSKHVAKELVTSNSIEDSLTAPTKHETFENVSDLDNSLGEEIGAGIDPGSYPEHYNQPEIVFESEKLKQPIDVSKPTDLIEPEVNYLEDNIGPNHLQTEEGNLLNTVDSNNLAEAEIFEVPKKPMEEYEDSKLSLENIQQQMNGLEEELIQETKLETSTQTSPLWLAENRAPAEEDALQQLENEDSLSEDPPQTGKLNAYEVHSESVVSEPREEPIPVRAEFDPEALRYVTDEIVKMLQLLEESSGFQGLGERIVQQDLDRLVDRLSQVEFMKMVGEQGISRIEMINALQKLILDKNLEDGDRIIAELELWKRGEDPQPDDGYFEKTYGVTKEGYESEDSIVQGKEDEAVDQPEDFDQMVINQDDTQDAEELIEELEGGIEGDVDFSERDSLEESEIPNEEAFDDLIAVETNPEPQTIAEVHHLNPEDDSELLGQDRDRVEVLSDEINDFMNSHKEALEASTETKATEDSSDEQDNLTSENEPSKNVDSPIPNSYDNITNETDLNTERSEDDLSHNQSVDDKIDLSVRESPVIEDNAFLEEVTKDADRTELQPFPAELPDETEPLAVDRTSADEIPLSERFEKVLADEQPEL